MFNWYIFRIFIPMRITKENIDRFINDTKMDCSDRNITKIDYIPDGIRYLHCGSNKLTELPKLPENLVYLYCFCNELTSLPKLPESLIKLSCYDNNLPYEVTLDNLKEHNKLIKRKEILKKICV